MLFALVPLTAKLNEAVVFPSGYYNNMTAGVNLPVLAYGKRPDLAMIACTCAIFLIQAYTLMRLLYPRLRRANVLIFFITAATWFAPLFADVVYYALKDSNQGPRMDHFALLSPLGTMNQSLDKPVPNAWQGIIAQGSIALIPIILFLILQVRARSARNRRGFTVELMPPALPAISPNIAAAPAVTPTSS